MNLNPQTITMIVTVVGFFAVDAFVVGYILGRRTLQGSIGDKIVLMACVVLTLMFVGGTLPLKEKIGSAVIVLGVIFDTCLCIPLLSGLSAGRRQQKGNSIWNSTTFVTFLLVALLLGFVRSKAISLLETAGKMGFGVTNPDDKKEEPKDNQSCADNLKSLYISFNFYVRDWDALPPAKGWMDNQEITSKVTKNTWFHCPVISNGKDDKYGYAYNAMLAGKSLNLGGKDLKEMPNAAATPLLFETVNLAKSVGEDKSGKPNRHLGKSYTLYCDGTVKAEE
ncbi:MAG: hypothetical protein NT023_05125 [Armatimonadetes bacterium]|nr:hypothetical protein [Armatimonadota bacterium]